MGKTELCIRAASLNTKETAPQTVVFPAETDDNCISFKAGAFPLVFRNHREGDRIVRGGHKRRFSDILDSKLLSGYTGIITVEDAEGPVAFVYMGRGGKLSVINRDLSTADASLFQISLK